MKFFKSMTKKKLALLLTAVFLVAGSISTLLVFSQVVPDARAQLSWEQGQVPAGSSRGNWQDYSQSWTVQLTENGTLEVNLSAVYVELVSYDGTTVQAEFNGQIQPHQNGELPEILGIQNGNRFRLEHSKVKSTGFFQSYNSYNDSVRGILRIEVPRELPLNLTIDLYSGSASLEAYEAASVLVSTSSGSITVTDIKSVSDVDLSAFSGDVTVSGLEAEQFEVSTSSGKLTARQISVREMEQSSFSGAADLTDVTARGNISLSTSSGKVTMDQITGEDLSVETFSGSITINGCDLKGDLDLNASSGKVLCEQVSAASTEVTTFAGSITLTALSTGQLDADASSGNISATLLTDADITCSTFSGKVELFLPKDVDCTVEVSTFSGKINVEYPMLFSSNEISKSEMNGIIGNGTHLVHVETSSGSITIKPIGE